MVVQFRGNMVIQNRYYILILTVQILFVLTMVRMQNGINGL